MSVCPKCGAEVKEGVKFCMNCGERIQETPAAPAVCAACGAPLAEGEKFCRACGAPAEKPAETPAAAFGAQASQGSDQPPQGGYQPPQGGYQPPQGGYQPPQGGYQPPQGGYQPPQGGYQPPQGGYQPPQGGYQPPRQPYAQQAFAQQQPKKKSHTGLFIGLGVAAVVIIGIIVAIVLGVKALVNQASEELEKEFGDLGGFTEILNELEQETEAEETGGVVASIGGEVTNMIQAGVTFDLKEGESVSYATHNNDGSVIYVGTLAVDEVTFQELTDAVYSFADDNDMNVDGYVHAKVRFTASFPDNDADEEGVSVLPVMLDYYNTAYAWDGQYNFTDSEDDTCYVLPIKPDGEEKEIYIWRFSEFNEDNGDVVYTAGWDILMPEGYDGLVLGYTDASSTYADTDATFLESYKEGIPFHLFRVK